MTCSIKHLIPFIFVGIMVTASAVTLSSSSDAAAIDEDVHGISYKDNSILRLGVFPGSNTAYQNVDWYITAHGVVEIYQDGELTETLAVDGLFIYKAMYEPGANYNVSIQINGLSSYNFALKVRSVISVEDVDPDAVVDDSVSMTSGQLQLMYALIGLCSAVAVALPIWYMYRRRREENKRTVINQ